MTFESGLATAILQSKDWLLDRPSIRAKKWTHIFGLFD
jgi:hypothetical protein